MDEIPWAQWPERLWGCQLTEGVNPGFCVQALLYDGLRVTPYDRHTGGNGRLQAAGMTADRWRTWYERVVKEDIGAAAELLWPAWSRSRVWPPPASDLHSVGQPARSVLDLWEGPDLVAHELASVPMRRLPPTVPGGLTGDPKLGLLEPLRNDIDRFRDKLPHVWIYVVDYPFPVAHAIRPVATVISRRVVDNPLIFRTMLMDTLNYLAS